ncbi:LOW QUALITY PROTEIN: ribonuclease P protein subunit p25-like [Brachionichthys hirsutus]|uniref:LOW QUALITY PROTEIN: ribonuclease P protein subunit p25-like n=1 Tax=Brachionichthys hirsutus TaxID=412623 RepID=UPI00360540D2
MTEPSCQMRSSNTTSSSMLELQSASFSSDALASSLSRQLGQSSFRRVRCAEDSCPCPIPGLASDVLHMNVKEGSKIRNLLRFATTRMQEEEKDGHRTTIRQVVFAGSGRGVTKTITCVEILKRKVAGLHQVSKLYYKTMKEVGESPEQGAPAVRKQKTVPGISILLSKDPLDPQEPGYQPPQTFNVPTEDADHSPSSQHIAKRVCLDDAAVFSKKAQILNASHEILETSKDACHKGCPMLYYRE